MTRLASDWSYRHLLVGAGLFAAGALWGGGMAQFHGAAKADVTETPMPPAFLAGGERSEIVLREIEDIYKRDIVPTLKQLEIRSGRIENRVSEIANRLGRRTPPKQSASVRQ
jgi:hypothetical protein